MAAPLARGWTLARGVLAPRLEGCPARAGMDPSWPHSLARLMWLPRSRGDGPKPSAKRGANDAAAPLARGWTLPRLRPVADLRGCPARAGMDPWPPCCVGTPRRLPRSRGDGPGASSYAEGGGMAAPLARGWTQRRRVFVVASAGCPARAGMDPQTQIQSIRTCWLPRSRGDGPATGIGALAAIKAAPLARGWTRGLCRRSSQQEGCPARAGMDPRLRYSPGCCYRLPRSRGDGPYQMN